MISNKEKKQRIKIIQNVIAAYDIKKSEIKGNYLSDEIYYAQFAHPYAMSKGVVIVHWNPRAKWKIIFKSASGNASSCGYRKSLRECWEHTIARFHALQQQKISEEERAKKREREKKRKKKESKTRRRQ